LNGNIEGPTRTEKSKFGHTLLVTSLGESKIAAFAVVACSPKPPHQSRSRPDGSIITSPRGKKEGMECAKERIDGDMAGQSSNTTDWPHCFADGLFEWQAAVRRVIVIVVIIIIMDMTEEALVFQIPPVFQKWTEGRLYIDCLPASLSFLLQSFNLLLQSFFFRFLGLL
jgi:hypothetical protein